MSWASQAPPFGPCLHSQLALTILAPGASSYSAPIGGGRTGGTEVASQFEYVCWPCCSQQATQG